MSAPPADLAAFRARKGMDRLRREWRRIVGPEIARVAWPVSVDPLGVLEVWVSDRAWYDELQERNYLELLMPLNEAMGAPTARLRCGVRHRRHCLDAVHGAMRAPLEAGRAATAR